MRLLSLAALIMTACFPVSERLATDRSAPTLDGAISPTPGLALDTGRPAPDYTPEAPHPLDTDTDCDQHYDDDCNGPYFDDCDGIDNDNDGAVDEGLGLLDCDDTGMASESDGNFVDSDGTLTDTATDTATDTDVLDCIDGDDETCDGADQDCDGVVDEGLDYLHWYADNDGDGYGDGSRWWLWCEETPGRVQLPGDCDDDDPDSSPVGLEVIDGADNDCDGLVDES